MLRRIVAWSLLSAALVLHSRTAGAQDHFSDCVSVTGGSASIIIPATIWPTVDGGPIAEGDEIAVFTPDGVCAGVTTWDGLNAGITIWGDNSVTQAKDGFRVEEPLSFRVWDTSADQEYTNVTVTYSSSRSFHRAIGTYVENAIYSLASLSAVPTLQLPVSPALKSPSEGAYIQSSQVPLSWNAVPDAASYELQVAPDTLFTSTVLAVSDLTSENYEASGLVLGYQYFWRVRAVNSLGAGPYSAARSFWTKQAPPEVPVLASPPNGSINLSTSLTLSWHASAGAASYDIQVSSNPAFNQIVSTGSGVTGSGYQPEGLTYQSTYYWRVTARNSTGDSDYSETFSFSTAPNPPKAPMLRNPANGESGLVSPVTFTWKSVSGASAYDVQVARDEAFASLVVRENGIEATTFTSSDVSEAGTYFWRARSVSMYGIAGVWSASNLFTVIDDSGPIVSDPIDDQKRGQGHGPYQRELDSSPPVFATASSASKAGSSQSMLSYSVSSSNPEVAIAHLVEGSELVVEPGEPGTALVTVTAVDEQGEEASVEFLFSVSASPSMIVTPDRARHREDQPVVVDVLMNDGYLLGSAIATAIIEPTWNGTATIQGANVYYTPARDFNGLDSLVYRIHDDDGNWGQAKVYFNVTEVDDPPIFADPNPIIRPGTHQHIVVGREAGVGFDLEGHSASDPEGEEVLYAWEFALTDDFLSPIYTTEYIPQSTTYVEHESVLPMLKARGVEPGGYLNTLIRLIATDGTADAASPSRWITFVRDLSTGIDENEVPEGVSLDQNYPNPFNPTTTISYQVGASGPVELVVFDVLGKEVVRLVDGVQAAGAYEAAFDATELPSGIYVYRLRAHDEIRTRTMILTK